MIVLQRHFFRVDWVVLMLVIARTQESPEIIGVILLVLIHVVVRPTVGVGVKTLEDAGKKVKQSS